MIVKELEGAAECHTLFPLIVGHACRALPWNDKLGQDTLRPALPAKDCLARAHTAMTGLTTPRLPCVALLGSAKSGQNTHNRALPRQLTTPLFRYSFLNISFAAPRSDLLACRINEFADVNQESVAFHELP